MIAKFIVGAVILIALIGVTGFRFPREYERLVVFFLGRYVGIRGPGFTYVIPFIESYEKVSLRILTLDVPAQEIMTKDNVPVEVNAVVYFRVDHPEDAIVQVNDYVMATSQIAQTTLRSVLGQAELDELLAEREKINQELQNIIDEETDPWGITVTAVEVKNVELPESMQRAMARQAEAERERRAKVIAAEGEHQAAEKLDMAAQVIGKTETGIQLRYLQTLTEVSSEGSNTIMFPIPVDMFNRILDGDQDIDQSPDTTEDS
ncbi:MAG: slipin family protein [bacterium]